MFNSTINLLLLSSFWVGLLHALEIDHLVAICSLVNEKSLINSIKSGIKWGLGHSLIIIVAGMVLIFFRIQVSEEFSQFFEVGVGIMIIFLGIFSILHTLNGDSNTHEHSINGMIVRHSHGGENKSFVVGVVHGLAGSSSFVLLLLPFIKSKFDAIWYLFNFSLGTIVGMGLMSFVIAIPLRYSRSNIPIVCKILKFGIGLIGIVVGVGVLIKNWVW
jgi:ABC-type nickel/cobalt efflux system permease component RcnA